jgi:hypothetical protein
MRDIRTSRLTILRVTSGVGGEKFCGDLTAFAGGVAGRSMVRCRRCCGVATRLKRWRSYKCKKFSSLDDALTKTRSHDFQLPYAT